jgi:diguanylate cyclase (GGDEF)-like protein
MNAHWEKLKIVVADDSPVYRKLVEDALVGRGYTVFFARNGREAIGLISAHAPTVVITDWEMPDVTGLELCDQIRRDSHAYTYIILLTSNAKKDQVIRGLDAGADDYLTKPFDSGELLARIAVGGRVSELHRQVQAKNQLLEELALTDALTGLPNRRAIEHWATRELSGAARHGFPFWVVMADLDRFKSVNDTYGHNAGDVVLKEFAAILKANTRASNMCARIGGEEFVLVLAHVGREGIEAAIARIRQQLEKHTFALGAKNINVTASFGISGFQGGHAPGFSQMLREADAALYAAKRHGRNRVEFAESLDESLHTHNSASIPDVQLTATGSVGRDEC